MSEKPKGCWKFSRGSLTAHYIVNDKAICGSGRVYEPAIIRLLTEKEMCEKCKAKLAKLEGSGTKCPC